MYTLTDKLNAFKYANERMKLEQLSYMHDKWPHIVSHIKYKVDKADTIKDYHIDSTFEAKAIKVSTEITQTVCELMSCNAAKDNGLCTKNDAATNYWVGENYTTPRVQCHPACFNLTKTDKVQSLPFEWYENECHVLPMEVLAFMEKPYFRSQVQYEDRVNDFKIGFDRDGDKLRYKYNEFYCDLYFGTWQGNGVCEPSVPEKVAGSILGHSLIKTTKLLSQYATTQTTRPIPPKVPAVPAIEEKYKVATWRANIDTTWQKPDPNMLLAASTETETAFEQVTELVQFDVIEHITDAYEKVRTLVVKFLESMATKEFWAGVGVQVGTDIALGGVKTLLTYIAQKTIPAIITELATVGSDFSAMALSQAMTVVFANTAARFAITEMGQLIRGALTLLGEMVSVVGFFILIANILDFIFVTFDFWHLEKQFSQETIDRITESGIQQFHNKLGTRKPVLTLELINALLVPHTEQLLIYTPKMVIHAYEYLFSLKTNSEGTPIDHGSINVHKFSEAVSNQLSMQITLYTPTDFQHYEATHKERMKDSVTLLAISGGLVALAIPFLFLKMYTMVIMLFVILLALFFVNYNVQLVKDPKKFMAATHLNLQKS